ncbi:reprolysin-like metallopeptidase [uncultured Algibacter sp.]|uniref:zinc-dependent metalloprotease n=1 Tax=uncultured Algibacter sp. TaxID=298659 RepID=UPI00260CCD2E|nr:zinc-dependent metalloprotease family protein [uncultured Algibacter sp.]
MKLSPIKNNLLMLLFSFFLTSLYAQTNQEIWSKISKQEASFGKKMLRKTEPSKSIFYQLDINKLKSTLSQVSKNSTTKETTYQTIQFPNSQGSFDEFKVKESSILEPSYQKKHPEIRTYIGQNIKNPSSTISFSITPQGLHGMTMSSKTGTQFIDPYTQNNTYIVYDKGNLPDLKKEFQCFVPDEMTIARETSKNSKLQRNAADSKLRTFNLALASTIEYSQFHWEAAGLNGFNTVEERKAAVLAAMVVTMNRVNTIFQRDLALKMILVDNSNIIFILSDNFSNDDANALIGESQTEIDAAAIATPFSYDIGHTFSTGGGGLASLNSPCVAARKAQGVTGSSNPVGDAYDIDFVAHEMGHQFGAPHTFNGDAGNCAGDNRTADNAYEPGSGTTIMAYAGICAPQNVQNSSDTYFHQKSIQMIWDNITTGLSTCGAETTLTNSAPVAIAGPDYTIPISTAYKLVGNSTDPDGTAGHTYTWEQYDLGLAGLPLEANTTGPLVRSFEGTSNPVRNIPRFADYISSGGSTTWEKLPSVNRTITFALTVRDNDVIGANGGGQTAVDFMDVIVNSTDPFAVVNPFSWAQGSTQNIEWIVGQSADVGTINCQTVSIKLSTDGGITFPTTITSSTPNDGSFSYTVPAMTDSANARILIEATDNIFYDISDFDFSISADPDFFMANEVLTPINCDETTVVYNFDYVAVNGFSDTTTFSALGLPGSATAIFSPTSRTVSGPVSMTISNLDGLSQGNYNITIRGTTPEPKNKSITFNFPFFNSVCTSVANIDYNTSTTLVQFNTINNSTGKGDDDPNPLSDGYSDYKTISTNVNRDSSYDLSVNVNTDGAFITNTKAWIDWNQNCEFDVGEEYNLGDASNVTDGLTGNSPLSIVIPNDAVLGSTVMRISTKFKDDGLPGSCENGFDGEVEDYTLNIMPTLSIEEFGFENFVVYPNPNKGEFTIKLNASLSSQLNIQMVDLRGRVIYKNIYKDGGDFEETLNLVNVQSGMYILNISDGLRRSTKKIIIE